MSEHNNQQQHGGDADMSGSELNEKTKVPLGMAVALVIGGATSFTGGAVWINSSIQEVKHEIVDTRRDLSEMKRQISNQTSRDSIEIWIIKFKAENPTIKVPEFK